MEIPQELVFLCQEISEANSNNEQPYRNSFDNAQRTNRKIPLRGTPKDNKKGVHYEWDENSNHSFGDIIDNDDFLSVGQWVRHSSWGRGQIVAREGSGEKMKGAVQFGPHLKKIAVAFAQLEPG